MDDYQKNSCLFCDLFEKSSVKYPYKETVFKFDINKNSRKFKKGENIINENEEPKGVFCVKSGKVKIYQMGYYGKQQIIRFATEGDLIGYRSVLSGEKFSASASALTETEACFIPMELIQDEIEANPNFAKYLLKVATHELGESGRTITTLAQKTVRERLAEVILFLEEKMGVDSYGFIAVSLTREEFSNLIGTATESAIRLISEFKSDEIILVEGRKIKILNRDLLKRRAGI